jgi:hypothetical protein
MLVQRGTVYVECVSMFGQPFQMVENKRFTSFCSIFGEKPVLFNSGTPYKLP